MTIQSEPVPSGGGVVHSLENSEPRTNQAPPGERHQGSEGRRDPYRAEQAEQEEATVGRRDARQERELPRPITPLPGADVAAGREGVVELGADERDDSTPGAESHEQEADRACCQPHF